MPVAPAARSMPSARLVALAAGTLITAGSALAGGVAQVIAPHAYLVDVPLAAELPLIGLFFAVGGFLLGLLRPGQDLSPLGRVRAWLDGLSVALAEIYLIWLLVFSAAGVRGAGLTAMLLSSMALAATVVAGLHATYDRTRMQWYAAGSGLCIAGLTAVILTFDYDAMALVGVVGALAIVAGAGAIRHGAVGVVPRSAAPPPAESPGPSGYPLLVLPLIATALATGYHLMQQHDLDGTSILLGVAGLAVLAGRETLNGLAQRRYAAHLAAQGEHLRTLVLGTDDVALVLDDRLVVRWQSPTAARLFGLSDQEVVGRPVLRLLHPDDADRFANYLAELTLDTGYHRTPCEVRLRDGYGAWRETECRLTGPDPARPGRFWVVHIRDVTERKELERALHLAAYTDRLTTLANRSGLRRAADPPPDSGALVVLELAGLTAIGDRHGPDLADTVLVEAARRLRTETEPADVPARLDGTRLDGIRFAVLTRTGAIQAHLLASRLLTALFAPYRVLGMVAHLTGRAGLADLDPQIGLEEAVRRAELAVRAADPGAIEWYEPEIEAHLLRRSALEQELPGALTRGELDLLYQPIVELPSLRPVGAEALLRWRHPELGPVPPAELVPVAERLGLLDEIGAWILYRVCRQLSTWQHEHPGLWIAVNTTGGQLRSAAFLATVTNALALHRVAAEALVFEVAEPGLTAAQDSPAGRSTFLDLVDHLGQLRALGARTAMDNFGAGPTSLSQLRLAPLDLLKIDRTVFGPPSPQTTRTSAIADVMVKLGTQLGIQVVAQHLESAADLDMARMAGCHYAQGYLLSVPLPAEHLEAYLDQHRHESPP